MLSRIDQNPEDWMLFLAIWIGFAIVTALAANARGRDPLAWAGIGFIGGVFALIAVLVMEPLNEGDEHR
ncbi:hypothetical protein U703_01985 [Rhodobacter capsulatus YW1]|nr:hypothetical protein U703_01985 [Rhodobacter capsulatus YW1]